MKDYLFTAFLSTIFTVASAQSNTFPSSGKVGIGTLSPRASLDVAEYIPSGSLSTVFGRLVEGDGDNSGTFLGVRGYGTTAYSKSFAIEHDFYGATNSSINFHRGGDITGGFISFATGTNIERLRIAENGNLIWNGYAAGNPRALNLGYSGSNHGGIGYNIDYTATNGIFNRPLNDQSSYLEFAQGGFRFYGNSSSVSTNSVTLNGGGANLNLFAVITNTGDFGIGTTNPQEKLSVNGKIRAKEIQVETANWPDYVFSKDYKLPDLKETEAFIKTNSHLPGVPSATVAEQEGIELGEMNKILLKKIEELTLHLIEKDKKIDAQEQTLRSVLKELEITNKRIDHITNEDFKKK